MAHTYGSRHWPVLVCRFPNAVRSISSGPLGGGISRPGWVLNAQVPHTYARRDPHEHLRQLA
ncbi:MAG TPA: adenosylcobinamide amidohydrolase, partial [Acidimicrobiales bacterium]|nr:adenosylcobinamide amidohydrolase [Acidimicrobiales bacterium]